MANYTLQKGIHGGYSVIRDNPWGILGYDDISDGHLTEAEASIFAWALKRISNGDVLVAMSESTWSYVESGHNASRYDGPTEGVAPCL